MGRVGFLDACVVGLLCLRREQGEMSQKRFLLGVFSLLLVIGFNLAVGFLWRPGSSSIAPSFQCVILSWTLGVAVFFVPFLTRTSAAWSHASLTFLGKISYSIYLLHPVMLYLFSRSHFTGFVFVIIVFASTILLSILTYRYIEKPGIAYAHAFKRRKPAQT